MTFFPCEKHQRFVVRPNEAWRKETLLPSVSVKHYNKRNPAKARRGLQRNKQEERIRKELRKAVPIKMEKDDWEDFNIATNCHICEKPQVIECFWIPCLFMIPTRRSTASRHTKGAISKTNLSGPNFNANHSTKWISGLKTIKRIVHTAPNVALL